MQKILIVEDEYAISQVLRAYLKKAEFETEVIANGDEALKRFGEISPDLVLLDVMLPGLDGWEVLRGIRKQGRCPVIMLTALSEVEHKLAGLNEGADDYIAKPFVGEEVVARVRAVLRRYEQDAAPQSVRKFGSLEVYDEAHRVVLAGDELELTPRDMAVLLYVTQHPNRTFTREQLIEEVWGWDYDGSDRAVDLSIKRLRKVLGSWPASEGEIKTIRGLGYQFCAETKG